MKRRSLIIVVTIVLCAVMCAGLAACGGLYHETSIRAGSFRRDVIFNVRISVKRSSTDPRAKPFITKKTVSQLEEIFNNRSKDFTTKKLRDDLLFIETKEGAEKYACFIAYYNGGDRYIMGNMSTTFYQYSDSDSLGRFTDLGSFIFPYHLVGFEKEKIEHIDYKGEEFKLTGTVEELKSFYEKNRYEIKNTENGFTATDNVGIRDVNSDNYVKPEKNTFTFTLAEKEGGTYFVIT